MIHLTILTSTDLNAPGLYEFEYDVLSIGRNQKNDLILIDNDVVKTAVFLIIENNSLFVQTITSDIFCYVNGKKLSGKKRLVIGDQLKLGNSTLEIKAFKKTSTELNFAELYESFMKKFPQQKYILECLDREIEDLENAKR